MPALVEVHLERQLVVVFDVVELVLGILRLLVARPEAPLDVLSPVILLHYAIDLDFQISARVGRHGARRGH